MKSSDKAIIDNASAEVRLKEHALAIGFDQVGISPATLSAEHAKNFKEFLSDGFHGDMDWMEAKADRRESPSALWPEVKSVISLGLNYGPATNPLAIHEHKDRGAISVYAQGRDYHDIVKKRLKVLARWIVQEFGNDVKVFVDTAPVMEKPLAMQAGIGWQGKHTNLVSQEFGSWLFLGEIYTTLPLTPDTPETDHCGTCNLCQQACQTNALDTPYKMDARKCISYLTIETKGDIGPELMDKMGNHIYGCDDCLSVCPWNKFKTATKEDMFLPRAELTAPRLVDLLALDDAGFRSVFAGSPIKRTGRDRFVRNVLIAAGNSADATLKPHVKGLLDDPSPLVSHAAKWALAKL